jgi:phosphoribosylamine--glycine ligase
MKILLIGNGAREHAILKSLKKSKTDTEVVVFGKAKNPGMLSLSSAYELGDIENMAKIEEVARKHLPDLAIVGPDNPIGTGAADVLKSLNIPTFAPLKTLARLESSKSFTRDLLEKYKIIGNPKYKVFTKQNASEIIEFMQNELAGEYVVKYDGLIGGKGVKLSGEHLADLADGEAYALECIEELGHVVVEEKFIGPEFSLLAFADGKSIAPMPIVQDHKRAFDGDIGPNTGGMGTYSDANHLLPFVTEQDRQEAIAITEAVQKALKEETGFDYCGIMYGGFIKTRNGVRLIEFNARFGDPEAMNVLTLLESDLLEIILACINQTLADTVVKFKNLASVCLYVVPQNYPDGPALADADKLIIVDKQKLALPNLETFYASVDLIHETEAELELRLSSSRAIAFTALAPTIEEARLIANQAVAAVSGKIAYRTDIGSQELIQKRIDLCQKN